MRDRTLVIIGIAYPAANWLAVQGPFMWATPVDMAYYSLLMIGLVGYRHAGRQPK